MQYFIYLFLEEYSPAKSVSYYSGPQHSYGGAYDREINIEAQRAKVEVQAKLAREHDLAEQRLKTKKENDEKAAKVAQLEKLERDRRNFQAAEEAARAKQKQEQDRIFAQERDRAREHEAFRREQLAKEARMRDSEAQARALYQAKVEAEDVARREIQHRHTEQKGSLSPYDTNRDGNL